MSMCLRAVSLMVVALVVSSCEKSIPVEPDARLSGFSMGTASAVGKQIYLAGWPCDSVYFLDREMLREAGPRDYDAMWGVACDNGEHAYTMLEEARGAKFTFDIASVSEGTTQGESRVPSLWAQAGRMVWSLLWEDPSYWTLGPLVLAAVGLWFIWRLLVRGVTGIWRHMLKRPPDTN